MFFVPVRGRLKDTEFADEKATGMDAGIDEDEEEFDGAEQEDVADAQRNLCREEDADADVAQHHQEVAGDDVAVVR